MSNKGLFKLLLSQTSLRVLRTHPARAPTIPVARGPPFQAVVAIATAVATRGQEDPTGAVAEVAFGAAGGGGEGGGGGGVEEAETAGGVVSS